MAFKKTLTSEADIVILGGNVKDKYPVGFEYFANDHIYKVVSKFYSDNTEWRRLRLDDGTFEDVTVSTIDADLETAAPFSRIGAKKGTVKAWDPSGTRAAILNDPNVPEEVPEEVEEPKTKKKVSKKVSKKSRKKNRS